MLKLMKRVGLCMIAVILIWTGVLIADRQRLNEELIRFHVVANSDSAEDQAVKLQVRDAVIHSIQEDLKKIADVEEAKIYLQENLIQIQKVANQALAKAGVDGDAVVSLCREAFDTRVYDTFSLPAGVYDALRITIGEGQGKNWWCVTFPALCLPATAEGFADVAAAAGFPDRINDTLTGEEKCEIRFFLLDVIGKIENRVFQLQ